MHVNEESEPRYLNHDQFTARINDPEIGGSSRRLHDNSTPSSGFMVSKPGMEWAGPKVANRTRTIAHREALKIFGHELGTTDKSYQGGWRESSGTFYDHSLRVKDLDTAKALGRQWHQLGVYDVANEVTHDIPEHEWEGPAPTKNILGDRFEHFQPRYREALGRHLRSSLGRRA